MIDSDSKASTTLVSHLGPFHLEPTPLDNTETPRRRMGGQKRGGNSVEWSRLEMTAKEAEERSERRPTERSKLPLSSPLLPLRKERGTALLLEKKFRLPVKSLRCYERRALSLCRLETTVTRLRKLVSKVFVLSCKKGRRGSMDDGWGEGDIKLRREFRILEDLERGKRWV